MKVAIIGHAADKFSPSTRAEAMRVIDSILSRKPDIVVSGRSPLGGIDIWAETEAEKRGIPTDIKAPKDHEWNGDYGFKARNLDIAQAADVVYVIVVMDYPSGFSGMRFADCYHCKGRNPWHVKSGACWTAWKAHELGKPAHWHFV